MTKRILNLRNVVKIGVACLAAIALMSSCKKDEPSNNTGGGGTTTTDYFGIKQATVTYDYLGATGPVTIYFDDYGRKFKVSYDYQSTYSDNESWIIDDAANKAYYLNDKAKTYQEVPIANAKGERNLFVWPLTEAEITASGYQITHMTIAGKDCASYQVTSGGDVITTAFWNHIVFLSSTTSMGDLVRATSITESITANIFNVPSDYTKAQ